MAEAPKPAENPRLISEADMTKYKAAGDIVNDVMQKLISLCVEGAKIIDLCIEGDRLVEEATGAVYNKAVKGVKVSKGIAFPTCVSEPVSLCSSDPLASQALAKDDVVKVHIGAHIDGFAAVSAETIVIGASNENPVTGRRADVLKAAWHAAEIAMRVGMLSCQQSQNVIDGKKRIILNPTDTQRRDTEAITFAEDEVYGIDILVSSGEDGKVWHALEDSRTSVYQKEGSVTYQLKMKNSRAVFSEMQKKAGAFPINIRVLEDEKRARLGLQEAVSHGLVKPYEVVYTPSSTFVAAFHFTIALPPAGPLMITHPPIWYKPELVKTGKELEDEELKGLLTKSLRDSKKKKKTEGVAEAK
ncbi:peptidase M24, structural domain-containing protein [Melanogaster broomeanus]|nr:peptidase M24, structural domain-containing protein [Melanogaster broomeanus]